MTGPGTAARIDVLHVDDDPDLADLTAELLEQVDEQLAVHTATHPDEGLRLLADREIDCVVSDQDMPGRTGIEFLEAVRETHPDLPFILYTAEGSERIAADAIAAGVTDYLRKSVGTDQYDVLANRIRNAVAARRATAEVERRRHRSEQLLKTVPSCVVRLDLEGRFVFANDRALEVLGLERDAVTDRTYNGPEWRITDLDGDPIPDAELPFRRVRDAGEPVYGVRHRIEWPDGTRKTLSVNGAPLFDADGAVESVVFSLSDITERVRRERELERTTARLEATFERSPDMIDVHTGDGTVVDVNRRFREAFDEPESELVGRKVWEFDRRMDPEAVREVWAGMDAGERRELETEYVRGDGERFPVEVHLTRLPGAGDGSRFVVISRDITDRKARERELRRYRHVVDAMNETACIYDEHGRYAVVNERLAAVYDATPEAMAGRESDFLAEIRHRADGDPFAELLDGEREEYRGELDSEFGAYGRAVVEYRLTPLVVDGHVEGVVSVARDVSDRKRRERELERARAEYEQLINGMNDAAWVIDADGSFLAVNDAAVELTGYTRSELLSLGVEDIDPTADRDPLAKTDGEGDVDGTRVFETVHETKAGERIPVEVSSSAVSYRGRPAELGVARDIADRKRRERRLEEFVSVVSHDLRNPLNVARGSVDLARTGGGSEHLDRAERAHERMQELIDDLLTLARQGDAVTDVEAVDLRPLVETSWEYVATGDATLRVRTDRTLRADQGRLRQLFENLIRNSVEHGSTSNRTESGDSVERGSTNSRPEADDAITITVGALPRGDGFYVEDDGVGIPADERETVFDAGYSTAEEGTGFGLSIVTQVAEDHGWTVAAAEGDAGGARFEVTGVEFVD
jgi:PAS domain S-box-containing protein